LPNIMSMADTLEMSKDSCNSMYPLIERDGLEVGNSVGAVDDGTLEGDVVIATGSNVGNVVGGTMVGKSVGGSIVGKFVGGTKVGNGVGGKPVGNGVGGTTGGTEGASIGSGATGLFLLPAPPLFLLFPCNLRRGVIAGSTTGFTAGGARFLDSATSL
jgi:hypothetical protein